MGHSFFVWTVSDVIGLVLLGLFVVWLLLLLVATLAERLMRRVKRLFRGPNP